jgi:probable rRNA maturation factor
LEVVYSCGVSRGTLWRANDAANAMTLSIQRASALPNIPTDRAFKKWIALALADIAKPCEMTLRIVNAAEGRNLNSAFRGKDYATNVLTFIYHEPKSPMLMGDVVLCAPVVAREARTQGKALRDHYAHLTIHGVLHLAGYDHVKPRDAKKMESLEVALLAQLNIADPYQDDFSLPA